MIEEYLSQKAREALKHIRDFIMQYGKTPSIRQLMYSMGYKSPRSAVLLLKELEQYGFLEKRSEGNFRLLKDLKDGNVAHTTLIPLVGSVNCGTPILAEENIQALIPISTSIAKPGSKYFLLKAKGDSMNRAGINHGDLILVKQQSVAQSGQNVVALIDDEATVKEFHFKGDYVTLLPKSKNKEHQPIILTKNFRIQGIVIAAIPAIK